MNFENIQKIINKGIPEIFPSASLLIGKGDTVLFKHTEGFASIVPENKKANNSTVYDIASLTKVISTTTLTMLLIQENKLSLKTPVKKFINKFKNSDVTILHLLTHTSGLPDWKPYYLSLEKLPSFRKHPNASRKVVDLICMEKPAANPDEKRIYSDLSFILLGFILEKIYGNNLDKLFLKYVAAPLKLKNCMFLPHSSNIAATEDCKLRGKIISGEVHDENAYALGGVAGHAGLFSNAEDIFLFSKSIIKSYNGDESFIKPEITREFFDFVPENFSERYAIGWDRPAKASSSAGSLFSEKTVGHLGFTGCSLWIDLLREVTVIFLTNRVHPSRSNEKIKKFRPILHDAINRIIDG